MIGDAVIIFLAVASSWAVYKLLTIETKYTVSRFCLGLFLASFLIGGIIAPNQSLLSALCSPEINGVIIDSETLKPVSGIDVVIGWSCAYYEFPYHSGENHVRSIHVKSDSNGQFHAPSRYKSLAIEVPPFYSRENSKPHISIFSLDYQVIKVTNNPTKTVYLKKIASYDELAAQFKQIGYMGHNGNKHQKTLEKTYKEKLPPKYKEITAKYGIPKGAFPSIDFGI